MNEMPEWLFVVIEKEEGQERLLGQQDDALSVSFIPAFMDQESGLIGLNGLRKVAGRAYEVQAMRSREVAKAARAHQYELWILDRDGHVIERLAPEP
jgi:hypothetical protein